VSKCVIRCRSRTLKSISSSAKHVMSNIKLDEENSKYASCAQYNEFAVTGKRCNNNSHCIKECNLITGHHFWLAYHNDWSRWFAISSAPRICCPSFSFMGGVAKK
jgi:hypothetical protein